MDLVQTWATTDTTAKISVVVLIFLSSLVTYLLQQPGFPKNAPQLHPENHWVVGALAFWSKRWDFCRNAAANSTTGLWSFHLGQYRVVGLSGNEGRKVFFESKLLDMSKGYAVLFGQSPDVDPIDIDDDTAKPSNYIINTLTQLLKRENMANLLPKILKDVRANFSTLSRKSTKVIDPFDVIYRHIAQVTTRTFGCDDIADDPKQLDTVLASFATIDSSATPMTTMFPRIPTPATVKRFLAGFKLYQLVNKVASSRKNTGVRGDDALQELLDQDLGADKIVGFIIGALFAGMVNTGLNSAWALCHLALNPDWLVQVREEVQVALRKHVASEDQSTLEQICSIPLSAWETEFPKVYLSIRETMRLHMHGVAIRANFSGRDIPVGTEIIPNKSFAVYHVAEVHLNASIYSDPMRWDPSRYLPERAEDKKARLGYLGWGAARHPCLGKAFANLEMTATLAAFITLFDFTLEDDRGNPIVKLPEVDLNQWQIARPATPVRIRYKQRAGTKF